MAALTESVRLETEADVALIIIDNPPVNALSWHVRQGLFDGMNQAVADGAQAIVLICDGRTFIAGADISEFGGGAPEAASLADAQAAMENAPVPVIAAIHGTALGGGLEVALCAHYRVALRSAKFGLPEVNLGLLPGAGGTQRLPRLVGVPKALEMMTSGRHIGTDEALAGGLADEVVDGDTDALRAAALTFATQAVEQGMPLVKVRDRDDKVAEVRGNDQLFADFRASIARKTRGFLAPEYNIRCIEAAVNQPFDEGMAVERKLFLELMTGPQSAAQRYYFFAERAANKIPDIAKDTPVLDIQSCGVLGAGTMGGGIAMNFANVGIPVTIVERDQEALDRGLAVVRKNYERSASRGSIPPEAVDERMGLIAGSTDKADFADCDIVIEAVFEDMELKQSIFRELDEICKPGAMLASNTSALDINEIAAVTSRPESVIGMHFFSPANVMKLLENVRGEKSSDTIVATAMAIGKRIGKVCVMVGVCRGFVGNRMLFMRRIEADRMILEGATPAQVDRVLYDFGFPMGPFAMSDLAGLDIGWKEETSSSSTVREVLCEHGRRGQKNGRGYYTYDPETRAPTPDPEVEQLIRDFAVSQGVEQREVGDDEVLERCLYPMVNEGAKILEEGIAIRGSDIDVVWVNGYGWPVYRGGPMHWADSIGLADVVAKIREYGDRLDGEHWELSPLLARLADEGGQLQQYKN
ncbi:MAG: 3-hydroxyacyl-CoA dehydrogenase NAD-binding domain-containing protein [Ilumatobacter sp.]|uniref:3-hydroxyacyl-CoA dehydrogenase NAD-binding domain-containing protein n=1 Tax=Ilumatobacter sp. TaxID=1967498 RepID=UPI00260A9F3B|nr:3-hydroxyacyl-CoA dehydrogenase NAD-binding domain-containing protein [Ilumatobacter sp.]MDJ0769973.1 3-hydroxyacyl-CoA dehydrogenase NAD-binding domain-containing protein [Ilumatobacter sp.]